MIKTALMFLTLLAASVPPLRADFKLPSVTAGDVKASAQTAPAPRRDAGPDVKKDWTIMVFMNGKSNIEPFALNDMNRFETVGSGEKVNIVVELGRARGLDGDTTADGDWEGVRRYFVVRDADKEHISSPVLMDLGNADMGDYKEAASFVKWAKTNYPARRYMFIIWDHGWGWIDPVKSGAKPAADRSISFDFASGNYIKTADLGKIFREAGRVDLYASMACFMQMAEVALELKDGADIIVGSEEVIQLPSFNFEDFFAQMLADPGVSAAKAGIRLVDTFKEMYSRPEYADMLEKAKYGVQLSAVRARKLEAFARKTGNWARLAMRVNDTAAYRNAKAEVLRFEVGDELTDPDKQISFYADLSHFVKLVNAGLDTARPGARNLQAAGLDLNKFIARELVVRNTGLGRDRTGKKYSDAYGIAIDIPGKPGSLIEYYPTYSTLKFEKISHWRSFMDYLEKIN
ncbi:MAG: clostripain-related cysteine peptidase [Elusimicrobiales bacterium]|jgi:hypothetical protein